MRYAGSLNFENDRFTAASETACAYFDNVAAEKISVLSVRKRYGKEPRFAPEAEHADKLLSLLLMRCQHNVTR